MDSFNNSSLDESLLGAVKKRPLSARSGGMNRLSTGEKQFAVSPEELVRLVSNKNLSPKELDTILRKNLSPQNLEKLMRGGCAPSEFWEALRSDYNYLMDEALIETCKEANSEVSCEEDEGGDQTWSFTHFMEQYNDVIEWLHTIQEAIHQGGDIRVYIDQMQERAYRRRLFNEHAQRLSRRYPTMKDEINWRLNLLNHKWDTLERVITPKKGSRCDDNVFRDLERDVIMLRKWLNDISNRLRWPEATCSWSLEDLEKKLREQQLIQREIESRSKVISGLLKLSEHLQNDNKVCPSDIDIDSVQSVAINLERRWHALWLQSLEYQCRLEELIKYKKTGKAPSQYTLLPGEPNFNHPTQVGLNLRSKDVTNSPEYVRYDSESEVSDVIPFPADEYERFSSDMEQERTSSSIDKVIYSDKSTMVGDGGVQDLHDAITQGEKLELVVKDIGYSSESSAHLSNDESDRGYNFSPTDPIFKRSSKKEELISDEDKHGPDRYTEEEWKHIRASPLLTFYKMTPVDADLANLPDEKIPEGVNRTLFQDNLDGLTHTRLDFVLQRMESYGLTVETDEKQSTLMQKAGVANEADLHLTGNNAVGDASTIALDGSYAEASGISPSGYDSQSKLEQQAKLMLFDEKLLDMYHVPTPGDEPDQYRAWLEYQKTISKQEHRRLRNDFASDSCTSAAEDIISSTAEDVASSAAEDVISPRTISSCDASGEYTSTGAEDGFSDESNSVISPSKRKRMRSVELPIVREPNDQAILRNKRRSWNGRPKSITELYQLSNRLDLTPFSISESALHSLSGGPLMRTSVSNPQFPANRHDSSDNTRQRSPSKTDSSEYRRTQRRNRARMSRSRRANSNSPNGSSQTITFNGSSGSGLSFLLGRSLHSSSSGSKETVGASSGAENGIMQRDYVPRLDLSMTEQPDDEQSESQRSKQAETINSLSDAAWDTYQEPLYQSSGTDQSGWREKACQMIENDGEDYRRAIVETDNDSDVHSVDSPLRRNFTHNRGEFVSSTPAKWKSTQLSSPVDDDSDSDVEDLRHVMLESSNQIHVARGALDKLVAEPAVDPQKYAELLATCQTNIRCLQVICEHLQSDQDVVSITDDDLDAVADLINQWEDLEAEAGLQQGQAYELQVIQRQIQVLSKTLNSICGEELLNDIAAQETYDALETTIHMLKERQVHLEELKNSVLAANLALHKYMVEHHRVDVHSMQDHVTDLYLMWDGEMQSTSSRLTLLESTLEQWRRFLDGVREIKCVSSTCNCKLALLASTVDSDLAMDDEVLQKRLSDALSIDTEITSLRHRYHMLQETAEKVISQSGEQTRNEMTKEMSLIDSTLRSLEVRSRALIHKLSDNSKNMLSEAEPSQASNLVESEGGTDSDDSMAMRMKNIMDVDRDSGVSLGETMSDTASVTKDEPDAEESSSVTGKGRHIWSWIWKTVLLFQFLLLCLFVLPLFFYPNCCDQVNYYAWSWHPQLRYIEGAPPT